MRTTALATLVLTLALAAAAQAQEPAPPPGAHVQAETVAVAQPPATAWLGIAARVRNDGPMIIAAVAEGSPAAAAGFAAGDTIVSLDGRSVQEHRPNFRMLTPGQRYAIGIRRGGEERVLTIVPGPPRTRTP